MPPGTITGSARPTANYRGLFCCVPRKHRSSAPGRMGRGQSGYNAGDRTSGFSRSGARKNLHHMSGGTTIAADAFVFSEQRASGSGTGHGRLFRVAGQRAGGAPYAAAQDGGHRGGVRPLPVSHAHDRVVSGPERGGVVQERRALHPVDRPAPALLDRREDAARGDPGAGSQTGGGRGNKGDRRADTLDPLCAGRSHLHRRAVRGPPCAPPWSSPPSPSSSVWGECGWGGISAQS